MKIINRDLAADKDGVPGYLAAIAILLYINPTLTLLTIVVLAVFGVSLLILWLLARMTLLSWADLTYVLPVTALGYVLTALVAHLFLHEQVSLSRWAGIALIIAGVSTEVVRSVTWRP